MKTYKKITLILVSQIVIAIVVCKLNDIYKNRQSSDCDIKTEKTEEVYKMKNSATDSFNDDVLYVGLRRSVYGLREKNGDNNWWVNSAKKFATSIKNSLDEKRAVTPVVIQIISGYSGDGTTVMGFNKPEGYQGDCKNIAFNNLAGIDHEAALTLYDKEGVKAILQFESGNSDVMECLEIANAAFGHHTSVIGYGIDAEWFFTKESSDETGLPISDNDAAKWLDKILSYNSKYSLFLKHWESSHMPPTFKNSNLWYLSDSQQFGSTEEMISDFSNWESAYNGAVTGYQYGYPDDKHWWDKLDNPTKTLSLDILENLKTTRFLFWVDFTVGEVGF